ncbi:MAG: Cytidylate kinase Cmk [Candidatus Methanohalarchaeum thermophilum]|uniref:Cytidylate kinase n=1 Tax=Methanohalarchaeum thermophilum TaxID=1903181 RepID=A0A1Q6DX40_METT1|nr:MAG: Cytidylate kinase Cmk [Candidatus Methanohalarchaeum thermophilum]
MRIAIGGPAGAGTSTTSKMLAEKTNLDYICAGDIFRKKAKEKDLTLAEFGELAEENPEIDKEIDKEQKRIGKERDDIIIEGRLSGWMVEDADIKIWLKAPIELRARRISQREDITQEEALKNIVSRERSEKQRYESYYDINIEDLSIYDLVIETSKWPKEAVVNIAEEAINSYKP